MPFSRPQPVVPIEVPDICRIFVDDSNTWIEGQKLAASGSLHLPKLIDAEQDPRFRLHMDHLVEKLLNNRQKGPSFRYGSQPAPGDTSKKSRNKYHLETKVFERSHGKEKQVDIAMAADIAFLAAELDTGARYDPRIKTQKRRTVFVVVTGDCDLLPSIEGALDRGIRVELWAWSSNLSRKYIALENQHSTLSVRHLDPFAKEISFLKYKSTWKTIDPAHAVVLEQKNASLLPSDIEGSITETLKDRHRLFYITKLRSAPQNFAVEFPGSKTSTL
ncbi:unnamed protein product [Parascedosporium putredinis]|uniref:NYN domain-containing protein n=1 Tax=Parascedosporium putredinis TaxID=1442378 RepID=A0A9P1HCW4_9PEZI|nr:unnamed protein product [Parascedosporium putredinis]CAI8004226.1 unnamed protein product [Parascedosporium putredinis]